ncbi:hypothetical protein [Bacillus solitudinis]|uniref:hypothetical protein n=1 Tax=Bacillus solitudinis TaxID=2014074 RepID=UPI000C244B80|nr:hypothetical protein [Bacillus solitudinis]
MMDHMINELATWLEAGKGHTLIIHKGERKQGEITDIDKIKLDLEDISVRRIEREDPDGYLANAEVLLHGLGEISTDQGTMPLPQNIFEIPLLGDFHSSIVEDGLKIETEKAIYNIYK